MHECLLTTVYVVLTCRAWTGGTDFCDSRWEAFMASSTSLVNRTVVAEKWNNIALFLFVEKLEKKSMNSLCTSAVSFFLFWNVEKSRRKRWITHSFLDGNVEKHKQNVLKIVTNRWRRFYIEMEKHAKFCARHAE